MQNTASSTASFLAICFVDLLQWRTQDVLGAGVEKIKRAPAVSQCTGKSWYIFAEVRAVYHILSTGGASRMAICPPAGKGAFHLVSCHCIFQKRVREWERKPVNMTKHHVNKTLKHYCSFFVTIPESKKVVYQWRHELPWSHSTHMFCSETPRLRNDILCGKDARADISDFKEHPKKITGSKILTKCAFTSSCSSHSGDWNAPLSERAALFRRHYGGRKLKWWMCLLISCTYKEKKCVR